MSSLSFGTIPSSGCVTSSTSRAPPTFANLFMYYLTSIGFATLLKKTNNYLGKSEGYPLKLNEIE